MSDELNRNHVFYANFVNKCGEEADVSGVPTISISHFEGVKPVVDVNYAPMNLVEGGVYAYNWVLPNTANTSYSVVYRAHYDGADVVGCEDFLLYDLGVSKKISNLSRDITDLDTTLRNEKLSHIIMQLDDLHKSFDDFKKTFVLTLSKEMKQRLVECLSDDDERIVE